ncbi:unnamed protein product [Closterium sp. NIES-54]
MAGVVEVAAGVEEVAAGVVVGAAVGVVAAVGLVEGVGVLVAAVEAAVGVAAVAAVGLVAVGLALGVLVLEVASISSSSAAARPSRPSSFTCGRLHTQHRCFSSLDDAWRAEFGDDAELPRWADLLRSRIVIFDLDFDAILSVMYALSVSPEGDCYRCVPPDPDIAAAALGASESGTLPSTAPAQALHTFTLDSGTSHCFFRDSNTLTPLLAPVPARLVDPSGGPVVARSSTVLPCPAVLSSSLSGLHLPLFSTNLVSTTALQDAMVTTTTPGGQRVSISMCTRTGRHLATFTRRPGSSLYTLAADPPQVAASAQVSAPSLCLPSRPRRLRPTFLALRGGSAPLLTPPRFPRRLLPCRLSIWTFRLQLRELFGHDLPVLRLHFESGGEFSSNLLRNFCRGEGILQSFTLPDSPQQNGIAERRIGLVMEVARTSMIHAAAPHFLWLFAVRYAADQLNLWPRVSLPETSPTLRWTGKVGYASVFRVWGSCAFVRDTFADKLSARAIPCVFLGFVPDAQGWQFYHPTSRRVFPSQDVTFDESVPFYCLFPHCSAPPPPLPLFFAPGTHPVDPLPPQGPAPSSVSQVDPLPSTAPVQVAVGSGAAPGAASGGAASGGAERGGADCEGAGFGGFEPGGEEPGGAESASVETGAVEPGGAESEGAESGGAEPRGAASSGGTGDAGAGGAGVTAGAGGTGVTAATGPGDPTEPGAAGAGGTCAGGTGAGGAGDTVQPRAYFVPLLQQVLGVPSSTDLIPPLLCPPPDQSQLPLHPASPLPAPSPYIEQSGGLTERREPATRSVSPIRTACRVPRSRPPPVPGTHTMALRPSSVPLHVPVPPPPESSLPEVPDPECDRARVVSPTFACLIATAVTNPSFESATASLLDAEMLDFAAARRLDYATALVAESESASPPSIGGECALGTDVLEDRQEDFECLAAAVPCFASMLLAPEGDPDAPDIPTPRSYAEAITGPYSSQWQAAMDAEMASWKSTGTYVDEVPPPEANIVDDLWIFRVKRPPGSPPAFMVRYVARGFSQRQGVDYFQTFSPTSKMTTLWAPREWHGTLRTTLAALGFALATADPSLFLRTDTSLPPFYVLVYVHDLVFATANTEALTLVKSELQKRHTCTDLGELRSYLGLQITQDRARRTITLTQSHMVHQVLQHFGFQFSLPQPTPLTTSHSLSAPPSDESLEPSGPYLELVGCLMYLLTCTRPDLAYPLSLLPCYVAPGRHRKVHWDAAKRVLRYLYSTSGMGLVLGGRGPAVLIGHADASWVDDSATQRSSQGYTFGLGSGSVSWQSTRSSSVLSSSCEAEIYAGAMAAQELRWLTYLLTDLEDQPRLPPIFYVDNKAMIALCQEHRQEHISKHIALRYFLARELQQRC